MAEAPNKEKATDTTDTIDTTELHEEDGETLEDSNCTESSVEERQRNLRYDILGRVFGSYKIDEQGKLDLSHDPKEYGIYFLLEEIAYSTCRDDNILPIELDELLQPASSIMEIISSRKGGANVTKDINMFRMSYLLHQGILEPTDIFSLRNTAITDGKTAEEALTEIFNRHFNDPMNSNTLYHQAREIFRKDGKDIDLYIKNTIESPCGNEYHACDDMFNTRIKKNPNINAVPPEIIRAFRENQKASDCDYACTTESKPVAPPKADIPR